MKRIIALLAIVPAVLFGAADDVKIIQRNPGDTNFVERTISPAASSVLSFNASKVPGTTLLSELGATTDASLLTSGTLPDARLSANVPLFDIGGTFSGDVTFSGATVFNGAMSGTSISATSSANVLVKAGSDGKIHSGFLPTGLYQTSDPELTALASVVSAADRLPYFNGSETATYAPFTAAGRALIDDANAAAQLTTLGGTTIGQSIFTLANPTAIRFIRINADNTATARSASDFLTDIGGGDVSSDTTTTVDSEVAIFSGTGGKTIKRATATGMAKLTSGVLSAGVAATDYVAPGATTTSGLTMATSRILGRTTASSGAIEEITVGSNLSLSSGTINVATSPTLTAITVDTEAYDATGWNGDLTVPTKDAVRDKIESIGSSGDVVGPASSTDEALARFDSTTGKLLQNGAVTLSDSGAFTLPDGVRQTFNPDGTNAGLNVGSQAGDPSGPSNGDLWYDSTAHELTARINGANVALGAGGGGSGTGLFVGRSAKTGAYTVVAGDKGYLIDCTSGTFSVSLTAAATLTDGFHVAIYNSGSGTITIDPNGSETIRDPVGTATTKTLAQGDGVVLVCNGTGFYVAADAAGWSASSTGITTADAVTLTAGTASSSTGTGTLIVTGGIGASGSIFSGGFFTAGNVTANQLLGNSTGLTINASGSNQNILLQASGTGVVRVSSISQLDVQNSTASTTTSTGGAVFAGGVGIAGQVTAGGAFKTTSTTASTSTTTGSGIFAGGVGVAGDIYGGGSLTISPAAGAGGLTVRESSGSAGTANVFLNTTVGGTRNWLVTTNFDAVEELAFRVSSSAGGNPYSAGTTLLRFSSAGSLRLNAYGAGTLTTDASGNVTATSDERLKDITGNFTRGLAEIRGIQPIQYKWRASTGRDTVETYSGFSAQNVLAHIPEAVDMNLDGSYALQDRALLAAAVNAIKELHVQNVLLATLVKDIANGQADKARAQAVLDALNAADPADKAARAAAKTAHLEQRVAARKAADDAAAAQRTGVK